MSKHRHSAEQITTKLRYAADHYWSAAYFNSSTGLYPFRVCQHQLLPRADRTVIDPTWHTQTGVWFNAVVVVLPSYHAGDDL
jgi:hypothetical protein